MSELMQTQAGGVMTLTLNRPERLNALNGALQSTLIEALLHGSRDDRVRAIVITGEGRGFCAGLDLSDSAAFDPSRQTRQDRYDEYGWVGRLALAIVHNDKPVIAAINGTAAGAGLALAVACDLRYMAESARVTAGYIRRGLSPDAGLSYLLPRLVGMTSATELILTGRDVSAKEAASMGLISGICPDDALQSTVADVASRLAAGPPVAMTLSKRLLVSGQDLSLEEALKREFAMIQQCFATQDVQEGIAAFAAKRAPEFRGE